MILIRPVPIRLTQIASSTVAYPDAGETVWTSGTTFAKGAYGLYEINGIMRKFESKQASNTNHIPSAYPDDETDAWWLDVGAANRLNMFDVERSTPTIAASPLVVELEPSARIGSLAIAGVVADDFRIEIFSGMDKIYDETIQLRSREVYTWRQWQYEPWRQRKAYIFLDLPPLYGATPKLTFTRAVGNVSVGQVVCGMPFDIGDTEYKIRSRGLNFTRADRDAFGGVKVVPRRSVPRTAQTVEVEKGRLNQTAALINELNGVITAWAGVSNPLDGYFDQNFVIGFYRETEYNIDNAKVSYLNIEIEGI